jgi:ribosome-associated heat shock protein Hsp15
MGKKSNQPLASVRLDKWLWASRFFKSRSNAVDAVNGGKVHLNGTRVKPSRTVKVGDELNITRDNYRYQVTVVGLNDKRRPAKEAQLLYEENEESIKAREQEREMRRLNSASVHHSDTKPNKKERRQIDKWRGR